MQGQEPKGWTPIEDARKAANILTLALEVLAAPIEVFLRVRFGSKYFGMPSAIALLGLPMWMLFWPGEDPQPILVFWLLFIVMQLRARIESARMVARGEYVHSRYHGWPRLTTIFRRMPERKIKVCAEPVFVFLTGVFLMPLSEPLGGYLLVAGFSSGLLSSLIDAAERSRSIELNDAWIEQQSVAERLRDMRRVDRR